MGSGIRMDFTKPRLSNRLNGLCTESELAGVLDVSDYNSVDISIPFFGANVDDCCSVEKSADKTKVFTTYANTVSLLYRKYMKSGCSEKDLNLHQNKIIF